MIGRIALVPSYAIVVALACSGDPDRPGFGGGGDGGTPGGTGGESTSSGGSSSGSRPGGSGAGTGSGGGGSGAASGGAPHAGGAGGLGGNGGGGIGGEGAGGGGIAGDGNGGAAPGSGGAGNAPGAGGAATGGRGAGGAAEPPCTLTTPRVGCDNCIRESCNSECRTCEGNDACTAILECAKTDCFADGKIDSECALRCISAHPSGSGVFQQLIAPQGCVLSYCGSFCSFF